ncbi:MAG TPA: peptidylprolyl isomerase [Pirellulaceae bacterium]|nr:peptidylprolyl isomerase [Pirellulaceae bacterium]
MLCCAGLLRAADTVWLARIGKVTVNSQDVDRELARVIAKIPSDQALVAKLREATLQEAVRRELALQWFESQGQAASDADVDLELSRRRKDLQSRQTEWAAFLKASQHTEASYRRETKWRLSWLTYLQTQLADANLQRYFAKHRAEFDGTELRVSHILWKAPATGSQTDWKTLEQEAFVVQKQIAAGELTFAKAAEKHSQAPTATTGGDIGFIGRHGPMPEAFSQTAFGLKSGEVSAPIATTFGVHIIQVTEVKAGTRAWTDAREDLKAAVTRYLFQWISDKQAANVKVEYSTGATP